jgi:hypothetical protein
MQGVETTVQVSINRMDGVVIDVPHVIMIFATSITLPNCTN